MDLRYSLWTFFLIGNFIHNSSPALFIARVNSRICILKEKKDETGEVHWSLPLKQLCDCEKVVAVNLPCVASKTNPADLWFIDDPTELIDESNWTPDILDELLQREPYCEREGTTIHNHFRMLISLLNWPIEIFKSFSGRWWESI